MKIKEKFMTEEEFTERKKKLDLFCALLNHCKKSHAIFWKNSSKTVAMSVGSWMLFSINKRNPYGKEVSFHPMFKKTLEFSTIPIKIRLEAVKNTDTRFHADMLLLDLCCSAVDKISEILGKGWRIIGYHSDGLETRELGKNEEWIDHITIAEKDDTLETIALKETLLGSA